jgi:RNA recognition motif-containing protein
LDGSLTLCLDDPNNDQQARGDPYCTLYVSRLSYDTTEHDLEREFNRFGPIERVSTTLSFLGTKANDLDSNCEE